MTESVGQDEVRTLAAIADLPLEEDRREVVAGLLSSWLPAANELSRKMAALEFLETMPITVLMHPGSVDGGE